MANTKSPVSNHNSLNFCRQQQPLLKHKKCQSVTLLWQRWRRPQSPITIQFLWTPLAGMLLQLERSEQLHLETRSGVVEGAGAAADCRVVNVVIIVAEGQRQRLLAAVEIFWGWVGASVHWAKWGQVKF